MIIAKSVSYMILYKIILSGICGDEVAQYLIHKDIYVSDEDTEIFPQRLQDF